MVGSATAASYPRPSYTMELECFSYMCPVQLCSRITPSLVFECSYSSPIWISIASSIMPHPPMDIHSEAVWLGLPRGSSVVQALCLLKIIFQAAIYFIWKERNAKIFTSSSIPAAQIRVFPDRLVQDMLLSLPLSTNLCQPSLLVFYFSCTPPT